ncbi:MAG: N-acetylmuramoyl-L-alanine amidase [Deltaproteobacteria bacterium]|nr:N-acetylmuramoyl-L-alanine amidase [Deltaproteobacteria bacterium]
MAQSSICRRILRKDMSLREPQRVTPLSNSEGIYIHYSAGTHSSDVDASLRAIGVIQRYHMGKGWSDIGYSWLVDDAGNIFEGRGWGVVGAHTRGYNDRSHAICYLGREQAPSNAALLAICSLIAEHEERYGAGYVRAHGEVGRTACPGRHLIAWLEQGRPVSQVA